MIPTATSYRIDINKNGELYMSKQTELSSFEAFLPNGSYKIAVTSVNSYGYSTSDISFYIGISGDLNADEVFNVSDVVLLQKWLLAVPDTHLANWKAADMCEDDRLDVFDLCMMKRALIEDR